jgi:aminopeptidase-like protein
MATAVNADAAGESMMSLIRDLYPICRSITGNGVRETLRLVSERIPLEVHEVPTGTPVFDWTVPKEWNVRDAWVKDSRGEKVIDFRKSNLHLVGYSTPIHRKVPRKELFLHLHTLPDRPRSIPYRNSFYSENWGFCVEHDLAERLGEPEYEVCIDSSLTEGHLTYGEVLIKGELSDEVFVWTHVCHPSLCNDNLSGIALSTELARGLLGTKPRYTHRFVFAPATIGAITWLAVNEPVVSRMVAGLVLAGVGDSGQPHYIRSRRGDALIDRAFLAALESTKRPYGQLDFSPYGYDQRQFCSPGFDLPVGCLMRTPNGRYPEYHTSGDDLDFVGPAHLADSLAIVTSALSIVDGNRSYVNQNPKCEPQLGRRGLYEAIGGRGRESDTELALLWVLNFSDGRHSLLDIAERSKIAFPAVRKAAHALEASGLLQAIDERRQSS